MSTSASSMVQITLAAMRFHVRVGILPHERLLPQPLEIDVTVMLHAASPRLDYRSLYAAVAELAADDPHDFLETLADDVARRVLGLDDVRSCRIAVRKPHVALPGPLAYAEIVVERAIVD